MPIRTTRSFTRPNTGVAFYPTTAEWKNYSKLAYTDTGLRTTNTSDETENGLVRTHIAVWKDQSAFDAFLADPEVQRLLLDPRGAYCQANGITVSDFTVTQV